MKLRSRIALSSLMLGAVALGLGQGSAVAQPMAGESTVAADCATHTDAVNSARSAKGGNRKDGNELTAAQANRMEASLAKAMAAKGYTNGAGQRLGPQAAAAAPRLRRDHGQRLLPRDHQRHEPAKLTRRRSAAS